MGRLSELFCAVLTTTAACSHKAHLHEQFLQMNYGLGSGFHECFCVFFS